MLLEGAGQDRLATGRLLRDEGIVARPVASLADLREGLAAGTFAAAVAGPAAAAALAGKFRSPEGDGTLGARRTRYGVAAPQYK